MINTPLDAMVQKCTFLIYRFYTYFFCSKLKLFIKNNIYLDHIYEVTSKNMSLKKSVAPDGVLIQKTLNQNTAIKS